MKRLKLVTLDALDLEDAASFKHVGVFGDLREVLVRDEYGFLVPTEGELAWDRALFLNLSFWEENGARDVLVSTELPADVMMHVAWHHLAQRFLAPSPEAELLSEAIASAFDLYLVGRVLGHAPDSTFLATQVPQMGEVAEAAGLDEQGFEALLGEVAADPDRAFEDLRALLYGATTRLYPLTSAEDALDVLASYDEHRFAPLLHHYELSTWVTKTRLTALASATTERGAGGASAKGASAQSVHEALAAAPSAVDWLEREWVRRALSEGPRRRSAIEDVSR
jgi:hypothetical protein